MSDDVERKGLGTPATRADIIEKLVKDGFVKREKKQMIPTEDGIKLITVLPDVVKSPKLTADWAPPRTASKNRRNIRKEKPAMPKLKTHSGAKKRFNLTKTGKVKRAHAYKSHILTKKTTKRTRHLRATAYADQTNVSAIKEMIPYK